MTDQTIAKRELHTHCVLVFVPNRGSSWWEEHCTDLL